MDEVAYAIAFTLLVLFGTVALWAGVIWLGVALEGVALIVGLKWGSS